MIRSLNGDQAMAHGALSSGIKLVTSYPGVGRDARGKKARALDIGEIARACGIES